MPKKKLSEQKLNVLPRQKQPRSKKLKLGQNWRQGSEPRKKLS